MKHLIACLMLATLPAWAAGVDASPSATPTAQQLEQGLTGRWTGALEYRDYQSGQRFLLPMEVQVQLGADGATLTRVARFDDGPQTGAVYITTVSLFDKTGQRVASASFRKGRDVEAISEDARVLDYTDAQHWVVVYQRRGQDGNHAADIRITQTRQGPSLVAVKEVKRPEQPDSDYLFRNQTTLVLQQ